MNAVMQNILVRKSLTINAPAAHAFTVFTERFNTWWPRSHHLGGDQEFTAIIEPRAGGRWYEKLADGSECDWGRVLAWEPPGRLLLTWDLSTEWKFDPDLGTEVEVRFIAETPERTRVEFEHRKLERYGDNAEAMRTTFDSQGGWTGVLAGFVQAAEKESS
jgi:uncharacterized protein YndB with AHSA1/START domain